MEGSCEKPSFDVVIGLGSNLGDRQGFLDAACLALHALAETQVQAKSSVVETPPFGGPEQGPYLNAALRLETRLLPEHLMRECLRIEQSLGRIRRERWGPRTIDLDILWIRDLAHESPNLCVPHPRLHERWFALEPLIQVAPDAQHPTTGQKYSELLAALPAVSVEQVCT
jgi:2-amino-4-hydroxy-6-hydroxymethyldihydropteridine diphosphokinase